MHRIIGAIGKIYTVDTAQELHYQPETNNQSDYWYQHYQTSAHVNQEELDLW